MIAPLFACSLYSNHVRLAATGAAADHTGSNGLSFNMKQKLWTPAFVLALMKKRSDFFHDGGWLEMGHGNPGAAFYFHQNKLYHDKISLKWCAWNHVTL